MKFGSFYSDRAIPSSNIDLHYAHCLRNLEKCNICGDMVPKNQAEEHHLSNHAPVACPLCSEVMEWHTLDVHIGENCPQRMVTCEYCEFPLPAVSLFEHQEVCGNCTEYCNLCRKYIRLCNRVGDETACTGVHVDTAVPPRDERPLERERPTTTTGKATRRVRKAKLIVHNWDNRSCSHLGILDSFSEKISSNELLQ